MQSVPPLKTILPSKKDISAMPQYRAKLLSVLTSDVLHHVDDKAVKFAEAEKLYYETALLGTVSPNKSRGMHEL